MLRNRAKCAEHGSSITANTDVAEPTLAARSSPVASVGSVPRRSSTAAGRRPPAALAELSRYPSPACAMCPVEICTLGDGCGDDQAAAQHRARIQRREVSSATMSAADCDFFASATP
jgi:hypothetical protein